MNRKPLYTLLNVMSYVFLIIVSFVESGKAAFKIPGVEPLLTPAPYAFYIWILIYILLAVWILRYGVGAEDEQAYCKVSRFFSLSLLCSGFSLIMKQPYALFLIFGAMLTALFMYISLQHQSKRTQFFRVPISMYLAWLMIAFTLELVLIFLSLGNGQLFGISEIFWTNFLLILLGLISIYFSTVNQDFIFPLIFMWAEIAIAVHNINRLPILLTTCGVILLTGGILDRCKLITKK